MKPSTALLSLALVAGLGGCGFRPLHAPPTVDSPALIGSIAVDQIDGKTGFILKNELDRLLQVERGRGAPRRLAITLAERIGGLGLRVDETASRSDLVVSAAYTLYGLDGVAEIQGSVTTTASYDIPANAFAEIAAQDDARERAGEVLAAMIRSDLALRLSRQQRTAEAP